MQSDDITELCAALVAAQAEFSAIPKGSVNPFFKSNYSDLADVKLSAGPVAAKHGLAVMQFPCALDGEPALETTLVHKSGQWKSATAKLLVKDFTPQGQGSGLTYMRRYAYMAALGLVSDEDDDGNKASGGSHPSRSGSVSPIRPAQATHNVAPPSATESGSDYDTILRGAEAAPDNDFLQSLATQYIERGRLSDKQIGTGVREAMKALGQTKPRSAPVRNEPAPPPPDDEELF